MQVEAAAAQVNTTDASLGNAIDNNAIIQMPMLRPQRGRPAGVSAGRDQLQLRRLRSARTIGAVNGGKPDQGYVTLDGADVIDQNARTAFTSVLRVTLDSVEEFRTTTTNGDAATGRGSGADVQLVTKSGTNTFHGSLMNTAAEPRWPPIRFSITRPAVPIAPLLINVFGGSAGGADQEEQAVLLHQL